VGVLFLEQINLVPAGNCKWFLRYSPLPRHYFDSQATQIKHEMCTQTKEECGMQYTHYALNSTWQHSDSDTVARFFCTATCRSPLVYCTVVFCLAGDSSGQFVLRFACLEMVVGILSHFFTSYLMFGRMISWILFLLFPKKKKVFASYKCSLNVITVFSGL
jgi:hypothetical protein